MGTNDVMSALYPIPLELDATIFRRLCLSLVASLLWL